MTENTDFTPPSDPWALFKEWFQLAEHQEPNDPNAMSLATVGKSGRPSVRIVLMKGFDSDGFTFFTNRQSQKGEQLTQNGNAALCWHWKSLRRQVRAEGEVHLVSDAASDAYFATRPRGSQIGAWASQQSQPLVSRSDLKRRIDDLELSYEGKEVPRPPYWGGYLLVPAQIEFWQDRPFRLHDRILYKRQASAETWTTERLYP